MKIREICFIFLINPFKGPDYGGNVIYRLPYVEKSTPTCFDWMEASGPRSLTLGVIVCAEVDVEIDNRYLLLLNAPPQKKRKLGK